MKKMPSPAAENITARLLNTGHNESSSSDFPLTEEAAPTFTLFILLHRLSHSSLTAPHRKDRLVKQFI